MIIPKWLLISFVVFSFAGFFDATFFTVEHYSNKIPPCSIVNGCEEVLTSEYSQILGVPVSLLGAVYYLIIFILIVAYLDTKQYRIIKLAARLTFLGVASSAFLLYLQVFVIKALCFYCIISAITSTVLFVLGIFVLKYKQDEYREEIKTENSFNT
jgi:uncharacterized membrane protein